jgi:penicillin-binding protein 2
MFRRRKREIISRERSEIEPDQIFLDSSNLPMFDTGRYEGRFEFSIPSKVIIYILLFFVAIAFAFVGKMWELQIKEGEVYARLSENNRLRHKTIFSQRGVIYDRNGLEMAWNTPSVERDFFSRSYFSEPGMAHVLGFVNYPAKDTSGIYFRENFEGRDGVELSFDSLLTGQNGRKIIEVDVHNETLSESVIQPPADGQNIYLSIDSRLNSKLNNIIEATAKKVGFQAGSGLMIDIKTGELIVLTNYPEYDSKILSEGSDREIIRGYSEDIKNPYMNRAVSGLYTPGSIIKLFIAIGALNEKVIDPTTQILSTGSISIANPYHPELRSTFLDWRAHGLVDMRRAIAVSSNVYFYEVGGGYGGRRGLGIHNIEYYTRLFGFGSSTGVDFSQEPDGIIPNPDWKSRVFDGDPWRLGDTYNTAIGQYGFQVTPLQALIGTAALASDGLLLNPTIMKKDDSTKARRAVIDINSSYFNVVKEGMRQAVTEGSAVGLSVPYVKVAAKTGTAELGSERQFVNSWVVGFFPYDDPQYAFAVVMEKGPRANLIGGVSVMRQFLDFLSTEAPEYFGR